MKSPTCQLIIMVLFLTLSGCKKTDKKECPELNPFYFELNQVCLSLSAETSYEDKLYVINSESELRARLLVRGSATDCIINYEIFNTDFSKYTLVVGQKKVGGIVPAMVEQAIEKNCENNTITYSATIKNGGYTAIGSYIFAIRIIKQTNSAKYSEDIKVIN